MLYTVIGLGDEFDTDAELLKDIAERGKGRIFFTEQPADLPQLFAQETVTIARSTFIETPTPLAQTGKWIEVSPTALNWLPEVDGYNLCYLRKGASASLITKDEYLAPLVAHSFHGIGRTLAVTFPLGGEFSQGCRNWDSYGDFIQTFTRWLTGSDTPAGIALRADQQGTSYALELHYDADKWGDQLSLTPPALRFRYLDSEEVISPQWRRLSPGLYQSRLELSPGKPLQGIVRVGEHALPFGPVGTSHSAEWDFSEEKRKSLRALSHHTGGRLLLDLQEAWMTPPLPVRKTLLVPFLILALVLLLLDAFLTRTGWSLSTQELSFKIPDFKWTLRGKGRKEPLKTRRAKREKSLEEEAEEGALNAPSSSVMGRTQSDLKSRLARAKQKK